MQNVMPEDYCSDQAVGDLFTTHLCIRDQIMSNYSVREESSRLWIDKETRALKLRASGISLEFTFDFKVWSEPTWLHDQGKGSMSVYDCDIELELALSADPVTKALIVDYSDAKINTRDYKVELNGETDISRSVESLMTSFKTFFEQELTSILASRFTETARETLTKAAIDYTGSADG